MRYYVHHTPGRLRVKIPILKRNSEQSERITRLVRSLEGVKRISVNTITGSVLINYDRDIINCKQVLSFLEEHHLFAQSKAIDSDQYLIDSAFKAGERIGRAALSWTVGRAFEGSPLSLLTAMI